MPILRPVDVGTCVMAMHETLLQILPPLTPSDRTCYRNLVAWVRRCMVADPKLNGDLTERVLSLAVEAKASPVRNARAFFVSLLRRDLGYKPAAHRPSQSSSLPPKR